MRSTRSATCSSSRAPCPVRRAGCSRSGRRRRTVAVNAPLLDASGKKSKNFELEEAVFGAEVKPHLVHEAVRAELNADRAGTSRAPQFTGGGVAFPPTMRSFEVKVNKKARHAAMRSALSDHAAHGTIAVVGEDSFTEPSTKMAVALLAAWEQERPLLLIVHPEDDALTKSFRNLDRTLVTVPSELEVSQVVWARSVLVSEAALEAVQRRAA